MDNQKIIRVTVSEASRLFGVDSKTIRRAIKAGALKYIVVQGRYKINFQSLLGWSQRQTSTRNKLTNAGIGQSTVVGIGGDQIIGFDFVDALKLFGKDPETKAVVLFGEVGGTYEEQAAEFIRKEKFKKPVVAVVAGKFTARLPQGTVLGHAGAIVAKGKGGYDSKVRAFKKAGVPVAATLDEIPKLLKAIL